MKLSVPSAGAQGSFFEPWFGCVSSKAPTQSALRRHLGTVIIGAVVTKKRKPPLEKAAQELTAIADKFLSSSPPVEQDRRVDNFEKSAIKIYHAKHAVSH